MDRRERWDDPTEIHRASADRHLAKTWTALPVTVIEDSDGFTVKLQPTIQGRQIQSDGTVKFVDMPELPDVPVQFAAGGGFTITHPIKKGDEGIAVFSARCIDGWWDKGGKQPPMSTRKHDLSDAMYIPGIRSKPRKLGGSGASRDSSSSGKPASTASLQIRSDDGQFYLELAAEGVVNIVCKTANITASDKIHCDTPLLEVTGDITASGAISAGKDITAGASTAAIGFGEPDADPRSGQTISLQHHRHGNVQNGPGTTSPPQPS